VSAGFMGKNTPTTSARSAHTNRHALPDFMALFLAPAPNLLREAHRQRTAGNAHR